MQKKLLSLLALLCLTVAGAWAQATPSVKELTVPESWSDDQTVFSAADLPGDFTEVSDEVAAAIPAPTAEGTAYLIYGFNGTKAKMVVYQNGVIARGEGEVTRKEICEAAYPPVSFKVYYTAASETVALTPVTGQTNQWTLAMPAGNVTLQVEYEPELAATLKALTAFTIEQGKATVAVADGTTDVTAQTTLADGKLSPLYAGQTITLTAQQGYKFRSVKAAAASAAEEAAVTAATPLTMECLTDGTIKVNIDGTLTTGMQYAVNGGTKTKITATTTIEGLTTGDKVQFYGVGTSTQAYGDSPVVKIAGGTAQVKVYGNIMSLLDEENFATKTDLPSSKYVFYGLFYGNAKLTDASGLLLPATTLVEDCYFSMFYGCTALTAAPALPATTLANYCYYQMFKGCTALTAAPELPATALVNYCYNSMFYGCSKLASVTCEATDISVNNCLTNWLYNAGTDASVTSRTLYVDPTMVSKTGWNNAGFTVTAIPGN